MSKYIFNNLQLHVFWFANASKKSGEEINLIGHQVVEGRLMTLVSGRGKVEIN